MNEVKIIFTGPVGAGKTTAVNTISDIETISTEAIATDEVNRIKETTTVGMDYGEIVIDENLTLRLYGTPGQQRFAHMWDILAEGALGFIILIDNSRPDALADLALYLDGFKKYIEKSAVVIAVSRLDVAPQPDIAAYYDFCLNRKETHPIVTADVRRREDILMVLDLLFTQLELE